MRRMRRHTLRLVGAALVAVVARSRRSWRRHRRGVEQRGQRREGPIASGGSRSFGWTNNFDPTGEYLANAFAIYSSLLAATWWRTTTRGAPATWSLPDIATTVPTPTNGGRTYTFHLKSGVKFGPPVNRAITSTDIKYALERLAKPKNGAQYGFYFNVIKGLEAYGAGKTKPISGIKTPNTSTIVFNLDGPTGDFPLPPGDAGGGARSRRKSRSASTASPASTDSTSSRPART